MIYIIAEWEDKTERVKYSINPNYVPNVNDRYNKEESAVVTITSETSPEKAET